LDRDNADILEAKGLMKKTFIIKGIPIPLARPRFSAKNGKNGVLVYDSQKEEKFFYGIQLKNQMADSPMFCGALRMEVEFGMKMPKICSKGIDRTTINHPCIKRPDLSNLIKFIEDAAIGILYMDDCIITEISAKKIYVLEPYTKVTLRQIEI
jgi:Holliday junction resolvase RusA-like endonuclease